MFVHKLNSALGREGDILFFYFIFLLVGSNVAIMQNFSFPEGVILTISVGWGEWWVGGEMNIKAKLSPAELNNICRCRFLAKF